MFRRKITFRGVVEWFIYRLTKNKDRYINQKMSPYHFNHKNIKNCSILVAVGKTESATRKMHQKASITLWFSSSQLCI